MDIQHFLHKNRDAFYIYSGRWVTSLNDIIKHLYFSELLIFIMEGFCQMAIFYYLITQTM